MSEVKADFAKWATGFSGCNGGDIGDPANKSIWVCGIESGGDFEPLTDLSILSQPSKGWCTKNVQTKQVSEAWQVNLKLRFFRMATKLLTVLNGQSVNDFESFAKDKQPFVEGSSGYFSLNLFPINFRNIKHEHWTDLHYQATGFSTKAEYIKWLTENRFQEMREWTEKYQPKLIICIGKSERDRFFEAFSGDTDYELHKTSLNEVYFKKLIKSDSLIVVIPFLYGKPSSYIEELGTLIKSQLANTPR